MKTKIPRKITKKTYMILGLAFLLSFMVPAAGFSWNQATHAYIADRLGARVGHDNMGEIWGSVSPDFYNYIFDPNICPGWISDETHGTYSETFMKVWNAAETQSEEALAFGFLTHNQAWGADFTAHISSLTLDQDEGYIIQKAKQLLKIPFSRAKPHRTFAKAFASLGMNPDQALLIAHVSTEYAVDIMLGSDVDPLLGEKLIRAARTGSKKFSDLITRAFGEDYAAYCFGGDYSSAASALNFGVEKHRHDMIFLGQAISQSKPVAVQMIAEELLEILPDFLGRPLPVPAEKAVEILKAAIFESLDLCNDYLEEIEATIVFVRMNLEDRGIAY